MLIPLMWEITLVYLNDMRAKFALDQKPLPLSLCLRGPKTLKRTVSMYSQPSDISSKSFNVTAS